MYHELARLETKQFYYLRFDTPGWLHIIEYQLPIISFIPHLHHFVKNCHLYNRENLIKPHPAEWHIYYVHVQLYDHGCMKILFQLVHITYVMHKKTFNLHAHVYIGFALHVYIHKFTYMYII